jgi:hypothetical protein
VIHDLEVEVTCDGPGCRSSTIVAHAEYMSDSGVEREIERDGWTVDGGSHYCGDACAAAAHAAEVRDARNARRRKARS